MARKLVVEDKTEDVLVYPPDAGDQDYKIFYQQVPPGVRKHLAQKCTKRGNLDTLKYAEMLLEDAIMRTHKPWEHIVIRDEDGNYTDCPFEGSNVTKLPEEIKAGILESLNEPVEKMDAELKNSQTSHTNSSTTAAEPASPVE